MLSPGLYQTSSEPPTLSVRKTRLPSNALMTIDTSFLGVGKAAFTSATATDQQLLFRTLSQTVRQTRYLVPVNIRQPEDLHDLHGNWIDHCDLPVGMIRGLRYSEVKQAGPTVVYRLLDPTCGTTTNGTIRS